jgi:hypothetical protein
LFAFLVGSSSRLRCAFRSRSPVFLSPALPPVGTEGLIFCCRISTLSSAFSPSRLDRTARSHPRSAISAQDFFLRKERFATAGCLVAERPGPFPISFPRAEVHRAIFFSVAWSLLSPMSASPQSPIPHSRPARSSSLFFAAIGQGSASRLDPPVETSIPT